MIVVLENLLFGVNIGNVFVSVYVPPLRRVLNGVIHTHFLHRIRNGKSKKFYQGIMYLHRMSFMMCFRPPQLFVLIDSTCRIEFCSISIFEIFALGFSHLIQIRIRRYRIYIIY